MTDVIILGGGVVEDETLRKQAGVNCKSLIPLGGRPMVEYVIRAFRGARDVGRVAVVGPAALRDAVGAIVDAAVEEGANRADNLFRGIEALPGAGRILMATSDTPLLTSAMVDELLAEAPACDICFPFVARDTVLRDFGAREWVFVKLRDGAFTGSSMALFRPEALLSIRPVVEQIIGAHREHWKVARMLGLVFLLRCRCGWISVAQMEARVSRVLGLNCRGYLARHAAIAFDMDHVCDLPLFCERLGIEDPAGR